MYCIYISFNISPSMIIQYINGVTIVECETPRRSAVTPLLNTPLRALPETAVLDGWRRCESSVLAQLGIC